VKIRVPIRKLPIHPSIARFLGRYGTVVESWDTGFNIQKQTLNGHAYYAYRYGFTDGEIPPEWLLRVSFGSRLDIRNEQIKGELYYELRRDPNVDFEAAANAYEVALFLSGNLSVNAAMPPGIARGIPAGITLPQYIALERLEQNGYAIGHVTVDAPHYTRRYAVIQGNQRDIVKAAFNLRSWPAINSRNAIVPVG